MTQLPPAHRLQTHHTVWLITGTLILALIGGYTLLVTFIPDAFGNADNCPYHCEGIDCPHEAVSDVPAPLQDDAQ